MSKNDDVIKVISAFYSDFPRQEYQSKVPPMEPERFRHWQALNAIARAPRLLARGAVKLYRITLSPLIGFHCRYLPTCSDYADQAIEQHGLWAGGWMTLARLLRCHPWGNSGLDFVPDVPPRNACWYLPWRYGKWRGTNSAP